MRWLIFSAALLAAPVRAHWFEAYNDVAWPLSNRRVSMVTKNPEVMRMDWVDSLETVLAKQKTGEELKTCVTMPKHYVKSKSKLFGGVLEKNPSFCADLGRLSFNPSRSASNFISLDAAIRGHSFTVIVTDTHSAFDETDSQPSLDEADAALDELDGFLKLVRRGFGIMKSGNSDKRASRATSDRQGRVPAPDLATAQLIAAAKLGCSTLVVSHDTDFSKELDETYRKLIEKNNAPVERLVFSVPSEYEIGKEVHPVTTIDQPRICKPPERTHLEYNTVFRTFLVVESGRMRVFPESDQKRVFHQGGQMRRARSRSPSPSKRAQGSGMPRNASAPRHRPANWSAGKPAETNAGAARRTERGRTEVRTAVEPSPKAGPPVAPKPKRPKRTPPRVAPKPNRPTPPVAPEPEQQPLPEQPPPVAPNAEQQLIPGVAGAGGSPQTGRQTRSRSRSRAPQTSKETIV